AAQYGARAFSVQRCPVDRGHRSKLAPPAAPCSLTGSVIAPAVRIGSAGAWGVRVGRHVSAGDHHHAQADRLAMLTMSALAIGGAGSGRAVWTDAPMRATSRSRPARAVP